MGVTALVGDCVIDFVLVGVIALVPVCVEVCVVVVVPVCVGV